VSVTRTLVPALVTGAALTGAAAAASFDSVRFARDAQADLVSAGARKAGINAGFSRHCDN
jgi:hypothetical protein